MLSMSLKLWASDSDEYFIPVLTSFKEAPWDDGNAPSAYDARLQTYLFGRGPEILIKMGDKQKRIVLCSKKNLYNISSDGLSLVCAYKYFNSYLISVFDKDFKERVAEIQKIPLDLSISNSDDIVFAYLHQNKKKITINYLYKNHSYNVKCNKNILKIALNSDGTMLALATKDDDDDYYAIIIIDTHSLRIMTRYIFCGNLVNLVFDESLLIESKDSNKRYLRNIILLDRESSNDNQIDFLENISALINSQSCDIFILKISEEDERLLTSMNDHNKELLTKNVKFLICDQ